MFVILSKKYFGFNLILFGVVFASFWAYTGGSFEQSSQKVLELSSDLKENVLNLPYQDLIQETADHFEMDEKLIASIIFVESSFRENAKSHVGAKGLMQIMPVVAKHYNVKNAFDPKDNLKAGAAHFKHWMSVIEAESHEDLIKMTLAAYNAGLGHLRDAQRLAISLKLSPHRWEHLKKTFVMLEDKKYYSKAKHGYCQGSNVNHYVQKVYTTYQAYKGINFKNTSNKVGL